MNILFYLNFFFFEKKIQKKCLPQHRIPPIQKTPQHVIVSQDQDQDHGQDHGLDQGLDHPENTQDGTGEKGMTEMTETTGTAGMTVKADIRTEPNVSTTSHRLKSGKRPRLTRQTSWISMTIDNEDNEDNDIPSTITHPPSHMPPHMNDTIHSSPFSAAVVERCATVER